MGKIKMQKIVNDYSIIYKIKIDDVESSMKEISGFTSEENARMFFDKLNLKHNGIYELIKIKNFQNLKGVDIIPNIDNY